MQGISRDSSKLVNYAVNLDKNSQNKLQIKLWVNTEKCTIITK